MLILSVVLSGCYVKVSGVETTGGGSHAVTTSAQTAGAARFSHGSASFSSGQRVSSGAGGGQVTFGKGASAVLAVGLVVADFLTYVAGVPGPRPLPPDERIMETCSCFKKEVTSDK